MAAGAATDGAAGAGAAAEATAAGSEAADGAAADGAAADGAAADAAPVTEADASTRRTVSKRWADTGEAWNSGNLPDAAAGTSASPIEILEAASPATAVSDEAAPVTAALAALVTGRVDVGPRVSGSEIIWRPPALEITRRVCSV